jgi:hypothetical protein
MSAVHTGNDYYPNPQKKKIKTPPPAIKKYVKKNKFILQNKFVFIQYQPNQHKKTKKKTPPA